MKWRSLEESTAIADLRPLREIFAKRKELISRYVPGEIQAVHQGAVSELKAQRLAAKVLGVGSMSPSFMLLDQNGKSVSSTELLSRGKVVILFFRGRWCPFCVGQLEAMNHFLAQIQETGASLIAISPQTVKQSFFMADQHKIRFPLLSDEYCNIARQFGLVYTVAEEQQGLYRRTMVNLPFVNGSETWELPIPATYIVEIDGRIAYGRADEDYTTRPEPAEIVAILEGLRPQH